MAPSVGDLRTIAWFSRWPDGEVAELAKLFVEGPSDGDQVLFDIGDPSVAMYLLTEGVAVLESPEDEVHMLYPPALLGELGALTGMVRSTKVTVRASAKQPGRCFRADALGFQQFLFERQELGQRMLRDLLRAAAEKIHRDQVRLGTLQQNAEWTQSELKEVLARLGDHPTALDASTVGEVRGSIDSLIMRNRRQNARVVPSVTMPVSLHLGPASVTVIDLSRTHLSFRATAPAASKARPWTVGAMIAGTLHLAGSAMPILGRIIRCHEGRITLALETMAGVSAAPLEGYLTRAQLLDILL
jgi:CRP/FNR family transcriptional regulator, cyclic AMP receptor protein